MPHCRNCHNDRYFGSSKVPPAAPTANGLTSGMCANFAAGGAMRDITCLGADKKTIKNATKDPRDFFDICLKCGSSDIIW
jgi:hypothetical protein